MEAQLTNFKVGEHQYIATRIGALPIFHIARKLSPVLIGLSGLVGAEIPEEEAPERFAKAMVAMSSGIPQADAETAIAECLASVRRRDGAGTQPIFNRTAGMQYSDIHLLDMMKIVWHVLKFNEIDRFFAAPASTSAERSMGGLNSQSSPAETGGVSAPLTPAGAGTKA